MLYSFVYCPIFSEGFDLTVQLIYNDFEYRMAMMFEIQLKDFQSFFHQKYLTKKFQRLKLDKI